MGGRVLLSVFLKQKHFYDARGLGRVIPVYLMNNLRLATHTIHCIQLQRYERLSQEQYNDTMKEIFQLADYLDTF